MILEPGMTVIGADDPCTVLAVTEDKVLLLRQTNLEPQFVCGHFPEYNKEKNTVTWCWGHYFRKDHLKDAVELYEGWK